MLKVDVCKASAFFSKHSSKCFVGCPRSSDSDVFQVGEFTFIKVFGFEVSMEIFHLLLMTLSSLSQFLAQSAHSFVEFWSVWLKHFVETFVCFLSIFHTYHTNALRISVFRHCAFGNWKSFVIFNYIRLFAVFKTSYFFLLLKRKVFCRRQRGQFEDKA